MSTGRISEHRGISPRTGNPLSTPPFSSIRHHVEQQKNEHTNYNITIDQFKILLTCPSDFELTIRESILIHQLQPHLNDLNSINLNIL